jgi:hypothetical protein
MMRSHEYAKELQTRGGKGCMVLKKEEEKGG